MQSFDQNAFPGLSLALDTRGFHSILKDWLSKNYPHLQSEAIKIGDVKYDAGKNEYLILYHLKLVNSHTRRRNKQLLSALVLPATAVLPADCSNRDEPSPEMSGAFWIRPARFALPDMKMMLYPFPGDPELPWLPDMLDPSVMKDRFNRMWAFRKQTAKKIKIRLLGYTPRMRASLLYEILVENDNARTGQWIELIAKTNAFKHPDRLFSAAWALWQACDGGIGFARPAGFMMTPRMTLQDKIEGIRLGSLVDSPSFSTIITETARAIARFHSLHIPLKTKRTLKEEVRSIERWSSVLKKISPELRGRIEAVEKEILDAITHRMSIRTPVHADFHHTNVLVDGAAIRIIDLDEIAYGDPCVDIGRFLASLRIPSLRAFKSVHALDHARELFLQEYLKIRDEDVANIRLFESAGLLTAAASAFRIQRENWENEVTLLLDESSRVLKDAGGGKTYPVESTETLPFLDCTDRLRWAADDTFMHAALAPVVEKGFSADLAAVGISKVKKLRDSQRLTYQLRGWKNGKKWKSEVSGIVFHKTDGSWLFTRLSNLAAKLIRKDGDSLVPAPLASLPHMGMIIFHSIKGSPLTSLFGSPRQSDAVARFARSLAAFHHTDIPIKKEFPVNKEFDQTSRLIEKTKNTDPNFHAMAAALWSDIETLKGRIRDRSAPVLYQLKPSHILYSKDKICITELADLRRSHPFIDAANFIADVLLVGLRTNRWDESLQIVHGFREAYLSAFGDTGNDLIPIEAAAMMRTSAGLIRLKPHNPMPYRILETIRQRIYMNASPHA